jgi:hypothetical protein
MKTLSALIVLTALVLVPAQTAAQTTNLTGKWLATFVRTAPNGQTQSITFDFHFTQKGKVLTGTAGPNDERQWPIAKGVVDGVKVTFEVQQTDGPLRKYTLTLEKDHLKGKQDLSFNGQTADTTVDAVRVK